jgi:hypothetical protein
MFKNCSHYNFIKIWNLFIFKFCANSKFVPTWILFQFKTSSNLKFVLKLKFIPNLNFVPNSKFVPIWNLFQLFVQNIFVHIQNLFKQKRKRSLLVGPNWLGPFGDRSQAGANRSRNGWGIAAATYSQQENASQARHQEGTLVAASSIPSRSAPSPQGRSIHIPRARQKKVPLVDK